MTNPSRSESWENEAAEIERALRGAAPGLPATLRTRTLSQCRTRAEAQRRRKQRLNRQLAGAVGGVLVLQSLTLFFVDSQHTQLVDGNSKPPLLASLSFSELSELWHRRSLELAELMSRAEVG